MSSKKEFEKAVKKDKERKEIEAKLPPEKQVALKRLIKAKEDALKVARQELKQNYQDRVAKERQKIIEQKSKLEFTPPGMGKLKSKTQVEREAQRKVQQDEQKKLKQIEKKHDEKINQFLDNEKGKANKAPKKDSSKEALSPKNRQRFYQLKWKKEIALKEAKEAQDLRRGEDRVKKRNSLYEKNPKIMEMPQGVKKTTLLKELQDKAYEQVEQDYREELKGIEKNFDEKMGKLFEGGKTKGTFNEVSRPANENREEEKSSFDKSSDEDKGFESFMEARRNLRKTSEKSEDKDRDEGRGRER